MRTSQSGSSIARSSAGIAQRASLPMCSRTFAGCLRAAAAGAPESASTQTATPRRQPRRDKAAGTFDAADGDRGRAGVDGRSLVNVRSRTSARRGSVLDCSANCSEDGPLLSFLEWLLDVVRPVRRSDAQFGQMRFLRQVQWWEATMRFEPIDAGVSLLIRAPRSGPTASQRGFVREFQSRYARLEPLLVQELRVEADELGLPTTTKFVLDFVEVPATHGTNARWRLGFRTVPPHSDFSLTMQDWEPVSAAHEC